MSGFKLVLWTVAAVGLGLFLGTYEISGRTPYEHVKRGIQQHAQSSKLDGVKERIGEVVEDAHDELTADDHAPRERHTPKDKDAVQRLIANGGQRR